jgi:CheY-like chemotaxis protein
VEDDLSTNWFLCGVLREAGAEVTGCFDGKKALDHAYREPPDLIMTDIVMPELDGFALCRTAKRDVLLRSVPVLMLSWKTDLLQRMRELGAGADGYLLKEASSREILQRVHELLRPRRIVEQRILEGGTVRGRLDGLCAVALLDMVSRLRPMSRLSIRDARFLYEIELRAGRPVLATRTDDEGVTSRGPAVIAALLGVGGGRFSVADIDEGTALSAELDGSLQEQLVAPVARVRAAQRFFGGTHLMRVHRVEIAADALDPCLAATPEPARSLVRAIAAGATPRDLIAEGRASAELVERVLCDAARQGAVISVQGASGELLSEAMEREKALLSGVEVVEEPDAPSVADAYVGLVAEDDDPPPLDIDEGLVEQTPTDAVLEDVAPEELSAAELVIVADGGNDTPVIAPAAVSEARNTPILTRVVTDEPEFAEVASPAEEDFDDDQDVDGDEIDDEDETPSPSRPRKARKRRKRSRRRRARRDSYDDDYSEEPPEVTQRRDERAAPFTAAPQPEPRLPRLPMPSAWATRGAPPKKKRAKWVAPMLFGIAGIGLAIGARYMRERQPLEPEQPMVITPQVDAPKGADAMPQAPAMADPTAQPAAPNELPVELPLSKKEAAKLKKGQGLLEIVAGRGHQVFVDGKEVGRGPVVKVPVEAAARPHEVRVKLEGEERVRYVVMKPGKRLRVRVAPPWSR